MNYWNELRILLSPDGAGGGGEEEDDQLLAGESGDDEGEEREEDEEGKSDQPSPALTKDDVTTILSSVIPAAIDQAKSKQDEPKLTEEEVNKLLNVWNPDTSFLQSLGIASPTADNLKALHSMRDALIRQANTMADARLQQYVKDQLKDLDEIRGYISEQRAAATMKSFYEKYPELQQYEEIVDAVSSKLDSNGFKADTQEKVFEAVGKGTHEVLKRMNVKVEASKANNGTHRMARLAGSGSPGGTGAPKRRDPNMAIFDESED